MRIHAFSFTSQLPSESLARLINGLPERDQQRIHSFRRWQDSYNCLFGKYLLLGALREASIPLGLSDLRYTTFGKPYFSSGPDFSISHSGNRVVCILSEEGGVGIDIEEILDLTISDFREKFSPIEWEKILNAPFPLNSFYQYWTAKESVVKADGRGLSLELDKLDVTAEVVWLNGYPWLIQPVAIAENYACHVAHGQSGKLAGVRSYTTPDFDIFQ
jgi:4'-phosphopantetheinyl transferase